jgi:two-component system chemotaxis response regulator CheY
MPARRVLSVGQCARDNFALAKVLAAHFDVVVDRVMFPAQALSALAATEYALVLVNRLIFDDRSPGLSLITGMKADPALRAVPVMLVSNYPEAQAEAVAAGALPGFGKDQLHAPETAARLAAVLPAKASGSKGKG